jgi:hypothetical protein
VFFIKEKTTPWQFAKGKKTSRQNCFIPLCYITQFSQIIHAALFVLQLFKGIYSQPAQRPVGRVRVKGG